MDECKTCASCRERKPVDAFNRNSRRPDGCDAYCRACRRAMHQGLDPRRPDPDLLKVQPGEKLCARCRESKPLGCFGPSKKARDGLFPYCRECKNGSDRASHARHWAKRAKTRKARYDENPEYYRARVAASYRDDPEPAKRRAIEWAAANPERRLEIRKASFRKAWEADPERFREAWRKRQAAVRMGCRTYGVTVQLVAAKVAYWGAVRPGGVVAGIVQSSLSVLGEHTVRVEAHGPLASAPPRSSVRG